MSDLGPCGGLTDTFDSFDGSKWTKVGTVDEQMKMLHETFSDGTPFTEARTKAGAHFEECYATIKVVTYPPETTVYLAVEEQKMGGGSQEIAYDAKGSDVFTPNFNDQLSADPRYLGIAFHAGQIYFLHNTNGAWTVVSSNARPAFLDDGPNDVIAIGLEKGSDGDEAFFDDYDVVPIHVADL